MNLNSLFASFNIALNPTNLIFYAILFIPLIIGLVALMLLLHAGAAMLRSLVALTWPTVSGVALEAYPESGSAFQPMVLYYYEVSGRTYRGYRLSYGGLLTQMRPRQYQTGASVRVRYNRLRPGDSVLEPQPVGSMLQFVVGSLLMGGAVVLAMLFV